MYVSIYLFIYLSSYLPTHLPPIAAAVNKQCSIGWSGVSVFVFYKTNQGSQAKESSSGIQSLQVAFKSDGCWKWIGPSQQLLSAVGCLNSPASPSTGRTVEC